VDGFGNVQLNATAAELGPPASLTLAIGPRDLPRVATFASAVHTPAGDRGFGGYVALVLNHGAQLSCSACR
jgi:hypothetical protein